MSDNQNVKTPEQIAQEKVEKAKKTLNLLKKELLTTEETFQASIQALVDLVGTDQKKEELKKSITPIEDYNKFLQYCELMVKLNDASLKHIAELKKMPENDGEGLNEVAYFDAAELEMELLTNVSARFSELDIGKLKSLTQLPVKVEKPAIPPEEPKIETKQASSLAIEPIQRTPRFVLLAKEMIKHGGEKFATKLQDLGVAYSTKANENVREFEKKQAMENLPNVVKALMKNQGLTVGAENKEKKKKGIETAREEIKKAIEGNYVHLISHQDLKNALSYLWKKDKEALKKEPFAKRTVEGMETISVGELISYSRKGEQVPQISAELFKTCESLNALKENSGSTLLKGNKETKEEGIKTARNEIKKAIDGKYLHQIPLQDLKDAVNYLNKRAEKDGKDAFNLHELLEAETKSLLKDSLAAKAPSPAKKEEPLQQALEGMLQEGAVGTQQRKDALAVLKLPPASPLLVMSNNMSNKKVPRPPATPSPKKRAEAVAEIMKDAPPLISEKQPNSEEPGPKKGPGKP